MRKRRKPSAEYLKYVDDLVAQFHGMFSSETECATVLGGIDCSATGTPQCPQCNEELRKTKKSRAFWCKKCKKTIWLTAGTFFAKKHRSAAWLLAIWLKEHGVSLGSIDLGQKLGVAQSSGWRIDKDLNAVMLEELEDNSDWTHSSFFREIFRRRSLETSRRMHPESEQDDYEWEYSEAEKSEQESEQEAKDNPVGDVTYKNQHTAPNENKQAPGGVAANTGLPDASGGLDIHEAQKKKFSISEELTELEKLVLQFLTDKPRQLEAICEDLALEENIGAVFSALTMLELRGLVEAIPGNFFARAKAKVVAKAIPVSHHDFIAQSLSCDSSTRIENFLQYICDIFQGISRKYLQNYLAGYWIKVSSRWQSGALLRACQARTAPWRTTIIHHASPLVVKMPLPDSTVPTLLTG